MFIKEINYFQITLHPVEFDFLDSYTKPKAFKVWQSVCDNKIK